MNGLKNKIKNIRKSAFKIARDKPGRRFENYHDRTQHHLHEHPVRTMAVYAVAAILIGAGFLFGFIPGMPGILLGLPGLALLAARSRYVAARLDRAEVAIRRFLKKVLGKFKKNKPAKCCGNRT